MIPSVPVSSGERRRTLVLSGVNMTEGGILSVLRNVIDSAERVLGPEWRIVVLAHRRALISTVRAEVREYPEIKSSWWRRMHFEWFQSRRLARELCADVWFALHDITPIVDVDRQFVYCHNPTCFSRPTLRSLYFDKIFVAHALLYGVLYSLNIRRNCEVFVQQSWIRDAFMKRFGAHRVVVARPAALSEAQATHLTSARDAGRCLKRWIYPTFPRHFKNVEAIGEALKLLEADVGWDGEVHITVDGTEGRYARYLKNRYGALRSLRFIGRQDAEGMKMLYQRADGLLFPSKLETWGLPISEAQTYGLPLLVADLEYARETVGTYDGVTFFDPEDPVALAALLKAFADGTARLGRATSPVSGNVPTLSGWDELVREVVRDEALS